MILSMIVAAAKNGVIGKNGDMPWHLPTESAYFRKTTLGHPAIMGRKTYESMPGPLPDRLNIIITSNPNYKAPEGCVVVGSLNGALELPEVKKTEEVFVIGGQTIYEQAMPLADRLYLTKINAEPEGDTFFRYNPNDWQETWSEKHQADKENTYDYEFTILERKP